MSFIERMVIGTILVGLFAFVGTALLTSHIAEYGIEDANTSIFSGIDKNLNEIRQAEKVQAEQKIIGGQVEDADAQDITTSNALKTLRASYGSVGILARGVKNVSLELGLADPYTKDLMPHISSTFIIIISVLFIFTIVFFIMRVQPR